MVREMIVRDRHHPSVLAWGLGDEIESNRMDARPFVEAMAAAARALDSTSALSACARRCHGFDQRPRGYRGGQRPYDYDAKTVKQIIEDWRKAHPGMPVFVTRLGMEVDQDEHAADTTIRCRSRRRRGSSCSGSICSGTFDPDGIIIWSFNDWRGDRPALTVHTGDPWMHRMGLVSDRREKRLAYDAVRAIFRGEKPAALPAGTYTSRTPIIYVLAGFVILIAVAYLYNVNRRFREMRQPFADELVQFLRGCARPARRVGLPHDVPRTHRLRVAGHHRCPVCSFVSATVCSWTIC